MLVKNQQLVDLCFSDENMLFLYLFNAESLSDGDENSENFLDFRGDRPFGGGWRKS